MPGAAVYTRLLPYLRPYAAWLVAGGLLALVVSAGEGAAAYLDIAAVIAAAEPST